MENHIEIHDLGVSRNRGEETQIIHVNRVFHGKNHPFWGSPIFGNTHIKYYIYYLNNIGIIVSKPL